MNLRKKNFKNLTVKIFKKLYNKLTSLTLKYFKFKTTNFIKCNKKRVGQNCKT